MPPKINNVLNIFLQAYAVDLQPAVFPGGALPWEEFKYPDAAPVTRGDQKLE